MNCEYVYTKNINIHLIHIVDKNNRRWGVYGNNLMNITLYICMNLLINLCDFFWKSIVLCGTLYYLCFLVITSVKRLLWGEIIDLVSHLYPLGKGKWKWGIGRFPCSSDCLPNPGWWHQHVDQCCANIQPHFRCTNSLFGFSLDS